MSDLQSTVEKVMHLRRHVRVAVLRYVTLATVHTGKSADNLVSELCAALIEKEEQEPEITADRAWQALDEPTKAAFLRAQAEIDSLETMFQKGSSDEVS